MGASDVTPDPVPASIPEVIMVDACTRDGRGGSPTAVVFDDAGLTDDARREIVRRAGTSHAAFIDPAFIDADAENAPAVRFFTVLGELANCGHGTIAVQAVLLDRFGAGQYRGRQFTGGRTFEASAEQRPEGIEVWFDQGIVQLQDGDDAGGGAGAVGGAGFEAILSALGVGLDDLAPDDQLRVASPGTPRLLVPLRDQRVLLSLKPDFERLAAECRRLGYLGCFVHVLLLAQNEASARMFAPAIGVNEDVVNANSAGCLAAHLLATGRHSSIAVHQGETLGRPSTVFGGATTTPDGYSTRIGGIATIRRPRSN